MLLLEAQAIFSELLRPFLYKDFFENTFSQKPLALLDENRLDRSRIIGADPKRTILDSFKEYAHTLTCHSNNTTIPPPSPHEVPNSEEFHRLIREYHNLAYTVRIPAASNLSPQLLELIRALELIFENPADVVVFWSAAGAAAPVHYDEYDVIAIQLLGTKKWFISQDKSHLPNTWKRPGEGICLLERYNTVDVKPGDVLYIPRGTPHTVQSTSESIHLSIGFLPVTTRDSIIAIVDYLSDLDKPLREGVTQCADELAKNQYSDSFIQNIKTALEKLVKASKSEEFIRKAMARRRAKVILDLPKLQRPQQTQKISINSKIKQNTLAYGDIFVTPEQLDFSQPGQNILIHPNVEESMRFITTNSEFIVSDIPGSIGDDIRIALVERLLQSGFLQIKN